MCVCVCVCVCVCYIHLLYRDYGFEIYVYRIYERFHIILWER